MIYEWKELERIGYSVRKVKDYEETTDGIVVPFGWCALFCAPWRNRDTFVTWGVDSRKIARLCCDAHQAGIAYLGCGTAGKSRVYMAILPQECR